LNQILAYLLADQGLNVLVQAVSQQAQEGGWSNENKPTKSPLDSPPFQALCEVIGEILRFVRVCGGLSVQDVAPLTYGPPIAARFVRHKIAFVEAAFGMHKILDFHQGRGSVGGRVNFCTTAFGDENPCVRHDHHLL